MNKRDEASFYGDIEGDLIRSSSARLLPKGRKNAIKHDFKSKNPTTRWSDIIKLR